MIANSNAPAADCSKGEMMMKSSDKSKNVDRRGSKGHSCYDLAVCIVLLLGKQNKTKMH